MNYSYEINDEINGKINVKINDDLRYITTELKEEKKREEGAGFRPFISYPVAYIKRISKCL